VYVSLGVAAVSLCKPESCCWLTRVAACGVQVQLVRDQSGKARGYAFVQFESEDDLKDAYRRADGRKIDGRRYVLRVACESRHCMSTCFTSRDRRVVVDVERARTVPGWVPRRLGGGLGETRKGGKDVNVVYSGRCVRVCCVCLNYAHAASGLQRCDPCADINSVHGWWPVIVPSPAAA
jgi:hypothetical protein